MHTNTHQTDSAMLSAFPKEGFFFELFLTVMMPFVSKRRKEQRLGRGMTQMQEARVNKTDDDQPNLINQPSSQPDNKQPCSSDLKHDTRARIQTHTHRERERERDGQTDTTHGKLIS